MSETPEPPSCFGALARRRWDEIWASVDRERVRPEVHGDVVMVYCQAYVGFCEAQEWINAAGAQATDGSKALANLYAIRDRSAKTMLKLAPELGLSPDVGKVIWPAKTVT